MKAIDEVSVLLSCGVDTGLPSRTDSPLRSND